MRCARCKRFLKHPVELNGLFYGPVCYKNVFIFAGVPVPKIKPLKLQSGTYFTGTRRFGEVIVTVDGQPLPPRLDLMNHSPDGFEWGYAGSGPAQLALAILAICLDDIEAVKYHQHFKAKYVQHIPKEKSWSISRIQVQNLINEIKGAICLQP